MRWAWWCLTGDCLRPSVVQKNDAKGEGKPLPRQGSWMLIYFTWNRNMFKALCQNCLAAWRPPEEAFLRTRNDLQRPYFSMCAWNYLLENLLAWACLDPGLMGQTRPLFLEIYALSQVLVVGARCECWSVVLAPEVLFHHLMPAGTILPFFAVLVVPRLWSRAVSIRLKFWYCSRALIW